MVGKIVETVLASTQSFFAVVGALVLIFFVVFYLIVDWKAFFSSLAQLVPPRYLDTVTQLAKE